MLGANPQGPRSAYAEFWGFRCGRHGLKSGCRGQILAFFHLLAPFAVVFKIQKYVRIPLSRGPRKQDDLAALVISVVYRQHALPVAWHIVGAQAKLTRVFSGVGIGGGSGIGELGPRVAGPGAVGATVSPAV